MEGTTIAIISSAVTIAVTYFGINKYHLQFLPMLGLLLAVGAIGTLITREINPPSKVLAQVLATMKSGKHMSPDIAIIDMIVGFAAFIIMAILLWRAYGPLRWLAIILLGGIVNMAVEFI